MKTMFYWLQRSLFLSTLILIFSVNFASAQSNNAAGVGLSPATIEDSAEPGETQERELRITNLSGAEQVFYIYTRDIKGVEVGGVPVFADEGEEKTGYELTEWLSIDRTELPLKGGEETTIKITIAVPEEATPGSHFGGVFVSVDPPRMRSIGAAVGYEVASIISLRVAGDALESAQLRSFATENYIYSKPDVNFLARVENKGNTLIRPVGPLEIFNMFGKRVAMITFNEKKAGVFPLTTRDFDINWKEEGTGFGRYQAILALNYGDTGHQATISSTATFWILPMNIILPALGVLAFLLLTVYISIKLYVRQTIQANGVRRRVARRRQGNNVSLLLVITIVMLAVTALFLIILLALFA